MKKNKIKSGNIIQSIFLIFLLIYGQINFSYAQSTQGNLIPNGKTVFLDNNGKPLSSGKVFFYTQGTTTPKTTYQDINQTIPNTNPVILDAAGRPSGSAGLWGIGVYRQVVQDQNGNLIWDVTTSTGGGPTGATATGDGDAVGTIKPWAGISPPNQYMFTYGQALSRTTYASLFQTITSTQAVFCTSGSPVISGLSDTNSFWIGMTVELSCVPTGFTTIIAKTSSGVTLAVNANASVNTNATFFPWGNGNHTTTFNLPDLRGNTLVANSVMGGIASSNLTSLYFGSKGPNSMGGTGGSQLYALSTRAYLPPYTLQTTIFDPGHVHTFATSGTGAIDLANATPGTNSGSTTTNFATTGITASTASGGGGIAVSAAVNGGGSGYTTGTQLLTVVGGTCSVQPKFNVTVSGGVITNPVLVDGGYCTVAPAPNPVATTGGGGTGGTLDITYGPLPISTIQPSITTNFIIKVTPDAAFSGTGVTSLGGMTGDIVCGTGLVCSGSTISVNISTGVSSVNGKTGAVGITGGTGITVDNSGSNIVINGALSSNYYIATTGSDSNNCTSLVTACLTLQHVATLINATGSNAATTINISAGSYSAGATFTTGTVAIIGAGSGVTTINETVAAATIMVEAPASVSISGLTLTTSVSFDLWALFGGYAYINSDVVFSSAPGGYIACQDNGIVYGNSNFTVKGISNGYLFTLAHCGMRFFGGPPVTTFVGSPVMNGIVDAINLSSFKSGAMQFSGGASVTTRYTLSENSTVDQEQNVTDWPGAIEGAISAGGVYYNQGPSFTGAITGTTLTVTGLIAGNGALGIGNEINGAGITAHTVKITAFGTGTGLNGTYTINTAPGAIGAEAMTARSIYPCIDSVGLCPVVVAGPTGLGVGGTASIADDGFGGDYGGVITLSSGSSGTGSSGALFVIPHSSITHCVASPSVTGAGTLASVAVGVGTTANVRWVELAWTNSGNLAINSAFTINLECR